MTRENLGRSVALLALLCALLPGRAEAQAKLGTDQLIFAPLDLGDGNRVYEPSFQGGEFHRGVPGALPNGRGGGGTILVCDRKLPFDPVIGAKRVGFLNTTPDPVKFVVEVNGHGSIHDLAGQEFMTLEVPDGAVVTGTVSTGEHDETQKLVGGALYSLAGDANQRWIFAKF